MHTVNIEMKESGLWVSNTKVSQLRIDKDVTWEPGVKELIHSYPGSPGGQNLLYPLQGDNEHIQYVPDPLQHAEESLPPETKIIFFFIKLVKQGTDPNL